MQIEKTFFEILDIPAELLTHTNKVTVFIFILIWLLF